MSIKKTTEEFISEAVSVHANKYDYSKVEYVNAKTKVCIICPEHGEFWQTPNAHLMGRGCCKCGVRLRSELRSSNTEDFIDKAKVIHGDRYDYSRVVYNKAVEKVEILCKAHGEFNQIPSSHLSGVGCPKCAGKNKTTEEFIKDAKEVHGDRYDYSKVKYSTTHENISIVCIDHGVFKQTPDNHLSGKGCPKCAEICRSYKRHLKAKNRRNISFEQPEDYKLIPLTQGKFAKVDNEDFDKVKNINWAFSKGYAYNTLIGHMHRLIMNAPDDMLVDHKEIEETLDNRRSNLRLATRAQNQHNQRPQSKSSSKYKGVGWHKPRNKWSGFIGYKGKKYHLGYFEDEIECAKVRDKKALELHGEFAYLNFPELKNEYLKQIKND